MNKTKPYKKICVIDSIYTFFVFLLVNNVDIKDYFFVFWRNMPKTVSDRVPYKMWYDKDLDVILSPKRILHNLHTRLQFYYIMTKNKLWGLEACGQDHLPFSRLLLNYSDISFEEYEDGLMNYTYENREFRYKMLRCLLSADREAYFGNSNKVKRIHMVNETLQIPDNLQKKIEWHDLVLLWKNLDKAKKDEVCEYFGLKDETDYSKFDSLILSRPLSEDGVCSETDKVSLIQTAIERIGAKKVIIKPHYRDKTNYKDFLDNISIMVSSFPLELFLLIYGNNIKNIISIDACSVEFFVKRYYPNIRYTTISM